MIFKRGYKNALLKRITRINDGETERIGNEKILQWFMTN